jgi:hypothetical protein
VPDDRTDTRVQVADTGVSLPLATGWVELPGEPMQLTIAVGDWDEAWGPRPNLNVLVADATEALEVQELATLAVSGIVSAIDEVHVMAYDLWPGPDDLDGRRIAFAYPQGGGALTACQWLFAHDTRSVTVTATCRVDHLTTFGEKFDALVGRIRLTSEGS